jgi:hypothetical protein
MEQKSLVIVNKSFPVLSARPEFQTCPKLGEYDNFQKIVINYIAIDEFLRLEKERSKQNLNGDIEYMGTLIKTAIDKKTIKKITKKQIGRIQQTVRFIWKIPVCKHLISLPPQKPFNKLL